MKNDPIPLMPHTVYHICTHAVKNNNFFKENRNYAFFLKKYEKFIAPIADTYAYCLMPNHFHLVLKIKREEALLNFFSKTTETDGSSKTAQVNTEMLPTLLSYQFSHFFNSYTKSFNKMYNRSGSLFERSFKRYQVTNRHYLKTAILYTIANPVRHGFTDDFKEWAFSAYWTLVFEEEGARFLNRDTVFNIFDGKDNFQQALHAYVEKRNDDWFE